jgi:hypothetical protein
MLILNKSKPQSWTCALELRPDRTVAAGSFEALAAAIQRGADLRIYTEFLFEEHIVPGGDGHPERDGLIREVIDFRETWLLDDRHVAGITTLRQPLHPPFGFNGSQPKLSLFLYNMDGQQACANVLLDNSPMMPVGNIEDVPAPAEMPKMSRMSVFDGDTTGPGRNFIYDMEVYRFFVRDEWEEVLSYDVDGRVVAGSPEQLEAAQIAGKEIKVSIRDLCADLATTPASALTHEVFTPVGSGFYHVPQRLYNALTHPLVRVAPAIPLLYGSANWDVSWVYLRSDGHATRRDLNPSTRLFQDVPARYACRWFAR